MAVSAACRVAREAPELTPPPLAHCDDHTKAVLERAIERRLATYSGKHQTVLCAYYVKD